MLATNETSTFFRVLTTIRSVSAAQLALLTISLVFVRFISRGIYRVYFHPLKQFPGPKLSAFTRLPSIAAVWNGVLPAYVARLHEQYGEVVRISPDELSFLHPDAWRDIYGHGVKDAPGHVPPKDWNRYGRSLSGASALILERDPAKHARSRKIFTPAFSERALAQQAPLFIKYADKLVEVLRGMEKQGTDLDLVRMYNCTTFDVMGDLTFGEPLHMLDTAEYDPWVNIIFKNIRRGTQLGLIYNHYPLVGRAFRAMLHKTLSKFQYEHAQFSATRVTKRLEKGRASEGVDLWDLILKQEEEKGETVMPKAEMDVNAGLFMVAGTETTATLLSGLTYMLLTTPDAMNKLVHEIRNAFTTSDAISMDVLAGLPYLNACVKEALRIYPPVPVGLPHFTPAEGSTICGHFIPPNTTVAAPHWAMYHSPTMFKDPEAFAPERWLGDARFIDDERAAVQPFHVGARDCLGKNMAYHEMRIILAKVLCNFDLELRPESQDWLNQEVYTLWQKKPLMVKVKAIH